MTHYIATESRTVPAGALDVVNDYGAHKDGTTDDSDHIQAAIDALGTRGGNIYFQPGTYHLDTELLLPPGNQATLTLWGYGATIQLHGSAGCFLYWNQTADYQSFKHFAVRGITVDGTTRPDSARTCWILGSNSYAGGPLFAWRCDVEYITLKDIRAFGATAHKDTDPGTGGCYGIAIGTKHDAAGEGICNYVRHIRIDNVSILGGDTGILVSAQCGGSGQRAMNAELDDIVIRNVYFDSGKTPTFTGMYGNTGIMVNQHARGGTVNIEDCFCKGTEDDLFEVNSCATVNFTRCIASETYDLGFQCRNQGTKILGGQDAFGNQTITYTDCRYAAGRESDLAHEGVGFGFAVAEVDDEDIVYSGCHWIDPYGVRHERT